MVLQNQGNLDVINTGSKEQLMNTLQMAEDQAQKIIDYRNQNGPFRSVDDLSKVSGIDASIVSKLKVKLGI